MFIYDKQAVAARLI